MKRLYVYIDASVIGGCEGSEFAEATLALWQLFIHGSLGAYIAGASRSASKCPESPP